ncbi:Stf0 family sulfotransferase [Kordiimonas sp.]|uniref:Stf0 family sulfotransferase n=1 Tax=Kordiimonas sp. TaxID=1970157 RepID=UPI003A953D0E
MRPIIHQHEKEILALYNGDRDKTLIKGTLPGKGVFVLFSNRCGSNYLVELMKQLPTLTMKNEMFNAQNVTNATNKRGLKNFEEYVRLMRKGCKTPHWGAKVGCVQLDMVQRFGLLDAFEEGSYIVWLKRKNIVAQAVSHYIAHHNKQWASFHEAKGETPDYDFESIANIVASIIKHNGQAEVSLGLLGIRYHALWYEDYISQPSAHMQRLADYLGEPFNDIEQDKTKFKKQADPIKKEYEARFRREARTAAQI